MQGDAAPLDYEALAAYLDALSYPNRLELLDKLRFPHFLGEIRLAARRAQGLSPHRPSSRQAVQGHIDKLVEAGLVRVEHVEQGGKTLNRFSVNAQKLYALTEDLRRLSTMPMHRAEGGDTTGTLGHAPSPAEAEGPRLVLVHGVYEGRAYRLDRPAEAAPRWVIGRKRSAAVSLDYDPFVSLEHAVVERGASGFAITDLDASKNGTAVNWRMLAKGQPRPLRSGDIVGVGRSLLCFAD
jgi:DNA-binding transcriptional ArsR family regulator